MYHVWLLKATGEVVWGEIGDFCTLTGCSCKGINSPLKVFAFLPLLCYLHAVVSTCRFR